MKNDDNYHFLKKFLRIAAPTGSSKISQEKVSHGVGFDESRTISLKISILEETVQIHQFMQDQIRLLLDPHWMKLAVLQQGPSQKTFKLELESKKKVIRVMR